MPVNKNAYLRYRVIDQCLQQRNRKWTKKDLLAAIDAAIAEYKPSHDGVSERSLQEDLKYMRSSDGFEAPIAYTLQNKVRYYYYEDPAFSINSVPIKEQEKSDLEAMIALFDRFEGAPQFDWLVDTVNRLEENLKINRKTNRRIMAFDDNRHYSGRRHIRAMAKFIEDRRKVKVLYQPFGESESEILFHPRLLKEYNNRWFVLGWNEQVKDNPDSYRWNLPLDRITAVSDAGNSDYQDPVDWENHFEDIIGVSRLPGEAEEVQILVSARLMPYLETKPLHGSQRKAQLQADGRYLIRLLLIPNYELEYQLLAFGEALEVVKPSGLRAKIQRRIKEAYEQYQANQS